MTTAKKSLTEDAAKGEVNDLMYDWINVLRCKSEGVYAYKRYLEDAKSQCCVDLLNRLIEEDSRHILEVKKHVLGLLEQDAKDRGYSAA